MVDSRTGQNVMQDGQKFNTLQDDGWLTNWTKCDARWSEIHLRDDGWLTNWTKCDARWSEIHLRDDGQLTNWMKCDARWSEIEWHLARPWLTHSLDEMWCEVARNATTSCKTMVDSLPGQNVMWDSQRNSQHLARWWLTHSLDEMWCEMVREI